MEPKCAAVGKCGVWLRRDDEKIMLIQVRSKVNNKKKKFRNVITLFANAAHLSARHL